MTTTRDKFAHDFRTKVFSGESLAESSEQAIAYFWDTFLSKEIKEAEDRMKKKCLKCLPDETPLSQLDTMSTRDQKREENALLWEIRNSISSL